MSTYSINIGQPTEATKLTDINEVLAALPDNTSKLIAPRDVRDAVYTAWETISIKTTSNGTYEYIGIDQLDDSNNPRKKMFFGKRTIANSMVMSNGLLTSDTDIFFYNNKSDSNLSLQDFKMSFLAGTNSLIWPNAPYLQAQAVVGSSSYIDLNIKNPTIGGSINIGSDYADVVLNGIKFPTIAESSALGPTYSGYVLKYNGYNKLIWDEISFSTTSLISAGPVVIQGNPVTINGYPIEFTDATPVVQQLGGVLVGMTFSNVPVVEMLRMLIYPYLTPLCSLSSDTTLIEYGSYPTITLSWGITKRSNNVTFASLTNSGFVPSTPYTTSTASTTNGIYTVNSNQTWTFTVSDIGFSQSATASATATLTNIYPYFHGMNANPSLSGNALYIGLFKLVQSQGDKIVNLAGVNQYVYFAYPASYPNLTQILDNNGYDVTTAFTQSVVTVNSSGLASNWSSISYKVYRSNTVTTLYGLNYTFKY